MSYTKHTWENGEVITADKLNNLEDGVVSGGLMVVSLTHDDQTGLMTLGKTWQEFFDALKEGVLCIVQDVGNNRADVGFTCVANADVNGYHVRVIWNGVDPMEYTTDTADGYPSAED